MKRLLFVIPGLYSGGAEKSLINLLNLMDYTKYDVDLLLFKNEGLFLGQVPDKVKLISIPDSLKYSYSSMDKTVFKNMDSFKAAVVRVFGTSFCRIRYKDSEKQMRWKYFYSHSIKELSGYYDVALAYLHGEASYYVIDKVSAGKKYIWVHNDYAKIAGDDSFFKEYFARANGVITISKQCIEILKESFPELKHKFYMLPNLTSSVLLKKMAKEYIPKEYIKDIPILLSIGRLNIQKGFDYAIEAAAILKERGYKFVWYILGKGEMEAQLRNQIEKKGVSDCFELLGMRENPYPYIQYCDVVVQPSRFEGKSVVIDEAKILAKPIVVTNYATVRDQVVDGKEGIVVDITPENIALGIMKMLDSAELREKVSYYLSQMNYDNASEIKLYYELFDRE